MADPADDLFLSDPEVARLAGSPRRRRQIAWLADRGYPFEVNAAGRPVVLRSVVLARLGERATRPRSPSPDFGALHRNGSTPH